jgi:hypothetical protein
MRPFARFVRDIRGGIAVTFAIAAPALLCVAGIAVDYANMSSMKSGLQSMADAAALAGAQELALPNVTPSQVQAAASSLVDVQTGGAAVARAVNTNLKAAEVTVDLERSWTPFFAHFLDNRVTPVRAHAKARLLAGSMKVCVIGLSPTFPSGVHLWGSAKLTAEDCGVYSNNRSSSSMWVDDNAALSAGRVCVAGGYRSGTGTSISPTPITDCPAVPDPLASRPEPAVGPCDFHNTVIKDKTTSIDPGVYCGGLRISGTSKVNLEPGVYVITGGPLIVGDKASMTGTKVGFYLHDQLAMLSFTANTTINLSAPIDGPMAGLLFFEGRKNSFLRIHSITSNNARELIGTIYFPKGIFNVDSSAPVADRSAYTAIVAYSLQLQAGPNLVLNSDYAATNVPVPAGLNGGTVVLAE